MNMLHQVSDPNTQMAWPIVLPAWTEHSHVSDPQFTLETHLQQFDFDNGQAIWMLHLLVLDHVVCMGPQGTYILHKPQQYQHKKASE